MNPWRYRRRPA